MKSKKTMKKKKKMKMKMKKMKIIKNKNSKRKKYQEMMSKTILSFDQILQNMVKSSKFI